MKRINTIKKDFVLGFGAILVCAALLSSCGGGGGGGGDAVGTVSTDATLASLVVSSGTLAPAFSSATTTYTADSLASDASIDVTGTVAATNATMKVNGTTVISGAAKPVSLTVGSNAITIVVTAADGITAKTYSLTVTRPVPSLVSLSPAGSTTTVGNFVTLTVTLDAPAAGATAVTLSSNDASVTSPPDVTIPEGQSSAQFNVTGNSVGSATITATLGADTATTTVTVNP